MRGRPHDGDLRRGLTIAYSFFAFGTLIGVGAIALGLREHDDIEKVLGLILVVLCPGIGIYGAVRRVIIGHWGLT